MSEWLEIHRGDAPLLVSFPHTGSTIPAEIEAKLPCPWLGRKDADWWIDRLYDFARDLGATTVRTRLSRTVVDVNRDPSGASLYPGQTTTGLCPVESFEGEPLYAAGAEPDEAEVARRRIEYFEPYHQALSGELGRLRASHGRVVLYDAHAIRSILPRLFEGELPHMNIGTFDGASCAPELAVAIDARAESSEFEHVLDGRFKGGWITRHYGRPSEGIHAVQMELAFRTFVDEPAGPLDSRNWPPLYVTERAAGARAVLRDILSACLAFARGTP
jgi:formiminoglutamase